MAKVKGSEVATIDVAMVTIKPYAQNADEILLTTANKIAVTVQTETQDKVPLIVKGILIAQKPAETTVTGNQLVITDNVFNAQVVKILQGGTIKMDSSNPPKVVGYTPPVVGSNDKGQLFELNAYSAIYGADGQISGYEQISYPNCTGVPIALNTDDGAFRAPQYTINSAPSNGEAPYDIDYVNALPVLG